MHNIFFAVPSNDFDSSATNSARANKTDANLLESRHFPRVPKKEAPTAEMDVSRDLGRPEPVGPSVQANLTRSM